MKRALLVLIVVFTVLVARAIAHSAEIKVVLPAQVEVGTSQQVSLKDLAKIQAPKAIAVKLGDVSITSAPLPGEERPLEAHYVQLKLSAAGFGDVKVAGAAKVTLVGKCRRVSVQQMQDTVKEFALGQLPQSGLTYDIEVERSPREMVLPDDPAIEVKPRLFSSSIHAGVNTIAIEALLNGRTVQTRSAVARIKATANVLMAVDAIPQGKALTEQNTKIESRDVTTVKDPILQGPGEDRNWVARRTIQSGSIITASDVALPPAIRTGDSVTLTVKCGSVALRTSAEAKQDGRVGDSIRVKSGVSNEDVRARITGPGAVEIAR